MKISSSSDRLALPAGPLPHAPPRQAAEPREMFSYSAHLRLPDQTLPVKPLRLPAPQETPPSQEQGGQTASAPMRGLAPLLDQPVEASEPHIEEFPGVSLLDQIQAHCRRDPVSLQRLDLKAVEHYEKQFSHLSTAAQFQAQTRRFRETLNQGGSLQEIRPQAYALARVVAHKVLGKKPYDSQMLGALAMEPGVVAQMGTGEGKTLAALMPLYLNALSGKGSHLVTVNDYLAKVGMEELKPAFEALGMTTGLVLKDQSIEAKRKAYQADVTYVSNDTLGFDFLNDRLTRDASRRVQREPHFALVDEIDQVLLDEARVPLIISGPAPQTEAFQAAIEDGRKFKSIVSSLSHGRDFRVDRKAGYAVLSETGQDIVANLIAVADLPPGASREREIGMEKNRILRQKSELLNQPPARQGLARIWDQLLGRAPAPVRNKASEKARLEYLDARIAELEQQFPSTNLYAESQQSRLGPLQNALEAHGLFLRGRDYTVQDGKVVLIDEFKGRITEGRRLSHGLHQALEIKEGLTPDPKENGRTTASITYPNLLRRYPRLAGMTGTASTAKEEFNDVLGLKIVTVPPRREPQRVDQPDRIFASQEAKLTALVERTRELFEEGIPVLLVSRSVAVNKKLADMLVDQGIPCQRLDAEDVKTNTPEENAIIAAAGRSGAVTVATNMAGRGVDIKPEPINYKKLAIACEESVRKGEKLVVTLASREEGERLVEWLQLPHDEAQRIPYEWSEGAPTAGRVQLRVGTPPAHPDDDTIWLDSGDFPGKKLVVLANERNLDARVDDQLRGRAGRQGAPGETQFFVSAEDDLLRFHSGLSASQLHDLLASGNLSKVHKLIERAQESAQNVQAGLRSETHKYDRIANNQREVVWGLRDRLVESRPLRDHPAGVGTVLAETVADFAVDAYADHIEAELESGQKLPAAWSSAAQKYGLELPFPTSPGKWREHLDGSMRQQLSDLKEFLQAHRGNVPPEAVASYEWRCLIDSLDKGWTNQLQMLDEEKQNSRLDAYIAKEPEQAYLDRCYKNFDSMWKFVRSDSMSRILPELVASRREVQESLARASQNVDA